MACGGVTLICVDILTFCLALFLLVIGAIDKTRFAGLMIQHFKLKEPPTAEHQSKNPKDQRSKRPKGKRRGK